MAEAALAVETPKLTRSLRTRHIAMISIGGIIGAGLFIWVLKGVAKGRFHAVYYLPVDLVGLYWHLVDLIWIFLFPLLYLVP